MSGNGHSAAFAKRFSAACRI